MTTIPSWYYYTLLGLACWGVAAGAGCLLWLYGQWQRVRHHQQVTEEWRRAHLDPDRPQDSPFR